MLKQNLVKSSWMLALAATVSLGVLSTSCEKESMEELAQESNSQEQPAGEECDTDSVSYSADVQAIFNAECTSCHNSSFAQDGINLSSYNAIQSTLPNSTRLLNSIKHIGSEKPMPQGGKLPPCDIATIEAWVNAGRPNN